MKATRIKHAFLVPTLLTLFLIQACSDRDETGRHPPATEPSVTTVTEIRLTKNTMGGNEAEASNGLMRLRVRGLYQQMFSADWYMGIKLTPLRDVTVSKVTCSSFTGKGIRLRDFENRYQPPAGQLTQHVERETDIPFIHPAASMLVTFYDQGGDVLSKFRITHIVDHMIGVGVLPATNRETYENADK